ncbi:MAG: molecular chaperone OsmY [Rhodocyclales bacterium]|nr:molecular chaperone OsmY [Rhodocyclales bacterium]
MRKTMLSTLFAIATIAASSTLWAADTDDTVPQETGAKLGQAANSAGQYVDDVAITTSVKAKLIADDTTKARDIKVTTRNGVVELSGDVDSARERRKAEAIATSVDGVQSVKNELKLKRP